MRAQRPNCSADLRIVSRELLLGYSWEHSNENWKVKFIGEDNNVLKRGKGNLGWSHLCCKGFKACTSSLFLVAADGSERSFAHAAFLGPVKKRHD